MTSPVAGLRDGKTRPVVTSRPSINSRRSAAGCGPPLADELSPTAMVAASCNGIRTPQHMDNCILIPGESYIPDVGCQGNGRNETGVLGTESSVGYLRRRRSTSALSTPSCERL